MPNKKLPDFPSVTTLQNNDIFLIESAATTSTVSYGTLSSSIINNTPRVNSVAIGTIAYIAATTPPAGYLECNGSAVSVSVYTDLTNAIYCGDGNNATASFGYRCNNSASPSTSRSTTGNFIVLPDLRGEFIRGWDNGRGVDSVRIFGSWQKGTIMGYDLENDAVFNVSSTSNLINGDTTQPIIGVDDYNISDYPGVNLTGALKEATKALKGETGRSSGGYTGITRPRNVALLPCIYAYNANLTQTAIDVASLINIFNSEINKINARSTLTSGTAITLTGTSNVGFNNIPSWVKRITISIQNMSTAGAYSPRIQIGTTTSGFITTGYLGNSIGEQTNTSSVSYIPEGFAVNDNDAVAAMVHHGIGILTKLNDTIWCFSGTFATSNQQRFGHSAGSITITGVLDRIRFTTTNSTGTYDSGTVNIMWE